MIPQEGINKLTEKLADFSPETYFHSQRVANLTKEFGIFLKVPEEQLSTYYQAGLLHDIGKIRIPIRIIDKPLDLNDSERSIIEKHPLYSEEIINSILSNLTDISTIVRHHHENFDGTGYPDGLSRADIPYCSRIIRLTDTFDVLTHERTYKKAYNTDKSIKIINHLNGINFDPNILSDFLVFMEGYKKK